MTDQQKRTALRRVAFNIIEHASDEKHDVDTAVQQALQTLQVMFVEGRREEEAEEVRPIPISPDFPNGKTEKA